MTVSQVAHQCQEVWTKQASGGILGRLSGTACFLEGTEALMPSPFASPVVLTPELRTRLQALLRAGSTPQALVFRCRLILRAGDPDQPSNLQIANEFGCHRQTVAQWRERFVAQGLGGLQDAPRSGRPRSFSPLAAGGRRQHRYQ